MATLLALKLKTFDFGIQFPACACPRTECPPGSMITPSLGFGSDSCATAGLLNTARALLRWRSRMLPPDVADQGLGPQNHWIRAQAYRTLGGAQEQ